MKTAALDTCWASTGLLSTLLWGRAICVLSRGTGRSFPHCSDTQILLGPRCGPSLRAKGNRFLNPILYNYSVVFSFTGSFAGHPETAPHPAARLVAVTGLDRGAERTRCRRGGVAMAGEGPERREGPTSNRTTDLFLRDAKGRRWLR